MEERTTYLKRIGKVFKYEDYEESVSTVDVEEEEKEYLTNHKAYLISDSSNLFQWLLLIANG